MRGWVPDVAAKRERERGGEESEGGTEKRARWGNCRGSRMKSCFRHGEEVFTFPGTVARDRKGGSGKVRGCRAGPYVVSGPSPWLLLGVWFHVSLGNDCLMEKLGALKKRGRKKKIRFPFWVRLSWSRSLLLLSLCILQWIVTMWLCEGGVSTRTLPCAHNAV